MVVLGLVSQGEVSVMSCVVRYSNSGVAWRSVVFRKGKVRWRSVT